MLPQAAGAIEALSVGSQVSPKPLHPLVIPPAGDPCQPYQAQQTLPLPPVEGLLELSYKGWSVWEGATEGMDEMPPIQLIGRSPALVTG